MTRKEDQVQASEQEIGRRRELDRRLFRSTGGTDGGCRLHLFALTCARRLFDIGVERERNEQVVEVDDKVVQVEVEGLA